MSENITLKYPITVAGQEITSLTMRRPKVRDMLVADKSSKDDGEKEVLMFANLCDVDGEVIQELDLSDYNELQKSYKAFLA